MRFLSMFLGVALITLAATEVAAAATPSSNGHVCRILTAAGEAVGKGASKIEALEAARSACGSMIIEDHFARRGTVTPENEDDLVLACVNKECS